MFQSPKKHRGVLMGRSSEPNTCDGAGGRLWRGRRRFAAPQRANNYDETAEQFSDRQHSSTFPLILPRKSSMKPVDLTVRFWKRSVMREYRERHFAIHIASDCR